MRVLATNAWFARLAPDLQHEVLQRCTVRRYAANTLVYLAGSGPSGFYLVLTGEIGLEQVSIGGKFTFYVSHGPGEAFGMLSELDGSPRFSDARALSDATIVNLPHAECQDLMRRHPAARDAFVAFICENLHTTLAMLVEHHSAPPRQQVAGILASIFGRNAGSPQDVPKLTHESLAAMAGISRQTAAKILRELRDQGLIDLQYGKIRPRDLARLQDIARH